MNRELPPGPEDDGHPLERAPDRAPREPARDRPPPLEGRRPSGGPAFWIESAPREDEVGLDEVWRVLVRRRWTVFFTLLAVVAAAALYTWLAVPVWEADTTIRVDEERPGGAAGEAERLMLRLGPAGQVETEMRVLRSRPILEDVAERLALGFVVARPADVSRSVLLADVAVERDAPAAEYRIRRAGGGGWRLERTEPDTLPPLEREFRAGERVEVPGASFVVAADSAVRAAGVEPPDRLEVRTLEFPEAMERLREALDVSRPAPDAQLIRVRYRSTDRLLAPRVPDAVAEAFLARQREVQRTEARSTVAFLQAESDRVERQLEAAEQTLQAFREERRLVASRAQAEAQVGRLTELQARRSELEAERNALASLLAELEADAPARPDYRRVAAFPTFFENQAVQSLLERLDGLATELEAQRDGRSERHPDLVTLRRQIGQLEDRLASVARDYLGSLENQIASLDGVLDRFSGELEAIPGDEVEMARLERRAQLLAELHTLIQTRLQEAEISANVEDPSIRVVEAAALPREPVSPRPVRNLALAGFLGLMLGVGLAFLREYTDRRIHSEDDLDRALNGTPILSRVPPVPEAGDRFPRREGLVAAHDGWSLPAESYRTLRTNVSYTRGGRGARQIVVTSPGARDGKSMTASNLAVTFAQQGHRTLLIDADMRRSVQHEAFEVERVPGLSDYLVAGVTDGAGPDRLEAVAVPTAVENLHLVPAGSRVPNPAELLDGSAMERLLARARESYDAVVVDTPPALVVTDASVVGRRAEGVLMVVRADQTDRDAAEATLEQLVRVGCDVLGVVFNDAREWTGYRYEYYDAYYGAEDGAGAGWRKLMPFG